MILPMMGFVSVLFIAGIIGGIVLYATRLLRHLSPFAFIPIIASLGALLFCWGLALGLERAFTSERFGGFGFFGGYAIGGLLGAWLGYRLAVFLRGRIFINGL